MYYILVEAKSGKQLTRTRLSKLDSEYRRRYRNFLNNPTPKIESVMKRYYGLSSKVQDKVDIIELIPSKTRYTGKDLAKLKAQQDKEALQKKIEKAKTDYIKKLAQLEKESEKLDKTLNK